MTFIFSGLDVVYFHSLSHSFVHRAQSHPIFVEFARGREVQDRAIPLNRLRKRQCLGRGDKAVVKGESADRAQLVKQ